MTAISSLVSARGNLQLLLSAKSSSSGSLHPSPALSQAQKNPRNAGESLATSDYSLPPAIPSLPQTKKAGVAEQWDSEQRRAARVPSYCLGLGFRVAGLGAPGGVCGPKEGMRGWSGRAWALAGGQSHFPQTAPPSRAPFPRGRLSLPTLRQAFSETCVLTLQVALVLGSWERLP